MGLKIELLVHLLRENETIKNHLNKVQEDFVHSNKVQEDFTQSLLNQDLVKLGKTCDKCMENSKDYFSNNQDFIKCREICKDYWRGMLEYKLIHKLEMEEKLKEKHKNFKELFRPSEEENYIGSYIYEW